MKSKHLICMIVVLLVASVSRAEMYQWVDEDGVVTFKDNPPPRSKKKIKVKVYDTGDSAPAVPQETGKRDGSEQRSAKPFSPVESGSSGKARFAGVIEMYVTAWCPACKAAEAYVISRNYRYVKYDIEKDSGAKQRYEGLGGHGVPLILVGGKQMSGFSAGGLERLLSSE